MFQRRFAQSDDVILEADEAVGRQQRGIRQRDVERPAGEDEDVDEARDQRRREHAAAGTARANRSRQGRARAGTDGIRS